ncbi:hypothetical protein RFI_34680, partial [Reticulomyxa filosa]
VLAWYVTVSNHHGSKFIKQDWFFQCSKCGASRFVFGLDVETILADDNREEDIPDLRIRYRQVKEQWTFEEIDIDYAISKLSQEGEDANRYTKAKRNINEKTNSKFDSQLKDAFGFL